MPAVQEKFAVEDFSHLIKFDKTKEYGTVVPPERGAHFFQNGFYFDHHGKLAHEWLDEEAHTRLQKIATKKLADAAAQKAREEFLKSNGLTPADIGEGEDALDAVIALKQTNSTDIDLPGWARGEKQYAFGVVRKAARDQYSYEGADKSSLIEWMIQNKKVLEMDVKR